MQKTQATSGDELDRSDETAVRSECFGRRTLSTKVDEETCRWVGSRAEFVGISAAEYLRRVLDLYRESARGNLLCPACHSSLRLSAGVEK